MASLILDNGVTYLAETVNGADYGCPGDDTRLRGRVLDVIGTTYPTGRPDVRVPNLRRYGTRGQRVRFVTADGEVDLRGYLVA